MIPDSHQNPKRLQKALKSCHEAWPRHSPFSDPSLRIAKPRINPRLRPLTSLHPYPNKSASPSMQLRSIDTIVSKEQK